MIDESIHAAREAERALLGALLISGANGDQTPITEVQKVVEPSDFLDHSFADDLHSRIFQAMMAAGKSDQITVAHQLNAQDKLQKGDCSYLSGLVALAPAIEWEEYAVVVHTYAEQRRVGRKPSESISEFAFGPTDLGNGERLIRQFGGILHYCEERKKWLIWNGRVWEWDMGTKIMLLATETVRNIYREAANEPDEKSRKSLADHAKRSEGHQRLEAMIEQAKARPGIPLRVEDLDKDPWLLNCNNGTINLKTGELQPHNPDDLITMIVPLDYDPGAKSEEWDSFLGTIFEQKETLICYMQRALGYSITGSQAEQAFFFNHGGGWNGKTTLLGAVVDILGPYAKEIEPEAFMVKKNSGGPNEALADLYKKRIACSTEIEDGQRLSVTLIKRMTGGEKIRCERKYEHGFDFLPWYKLWLSGNHEPVITDTTNSIWYRLKRIPFKVSIPEDKRIKDYRHTLSGEHGEAILAWLVIGCLEWQKMGLGEPPEVLQAIKQYREEQDILHDFLAECSIFQPSATITNTDFYKAYKQWCDENDTHCVGKNTFGTRLKEKGLMTDRGAHNKLIWRGIRLSTEEEKVTLVTLGTGFSQPFLREENMEKGSVKEVTKVTKVTQDIPDYPSTPCPTCGGDYYLSDDNRWLCKRCHPKPGGEE